MCCCSSSRVRASAALGLGRNRSVCRCLASSVRAWRRFVAGGHRSDCRSVVNCCLLYHGLAAVIRTSSAVSVSITTGRIAHRTTSCGVYRLEALRLRKIAGSGRGTQPEKVALQAQGFAAITRHRLVSSWRSLANFGVNEFQERYWTIPEALSRHSCDSTSRSHQGKNMG